MDGGVTMNDVQQLFMAPDGGANKSNLDLWKIQPGGGTVMIEYANRMNNMWWAAHATDDGTPSGNPAPNWGMVLYQIKEMPEIQEVFETTRPANKALLKNFESSYLTTAAGSLDEVAKAAQAGTKTLADFETAYDNAINGCNVCHAATNHQFVKNHAPDGACSRQRRLARPVTHTAAEAAPEQFLPRGPGIRHGPRTGFVCRGGAGTRASHGTAWRACAPHARAPRRVWRRRAR